MKQYLRYSKYLFVFIIFFLCLIFSYHLFFGDSIVNYGFSYAIVKGEVPYKDFNLIIPLLAPFLYAIPLLLVRSSLVFYLTQAGLLTGMFYLLEKKLSYKIYLFFLIIAFSYPLLLSSGLFPGYNFILFLLIVLISYLEEKNSNDYLIGFLIGLSIITKHTIGLFLIIPSILFYYKDLKKLLKRGIGILIPIIIFLLYLFITKSFMQFIDLCILGLFDFAYKNKVIPNMIYILLFVIGIIYFIIILWKEKNIYDWYYFFTFLFVFPLFDDYHFSYFVYSFLIVSLNHISYSTLYKKISIIFLFLIIGIWTIISFSYKDSYLNYRHYPLRYMNKMMLDDYHYIDTIYHKYDNKVILFLLGTENYFYKITNDLDITYFDLPHYGNYGKDSFIKMKKRLLSSHDVYIIIKEDVFSKDFNSHQYYKELALFIKKHGVFMEHNHSYGVYYFS